MQKIKWDSRFAIGLQEIDRHHRHLVGLLSQAHDQYQEGRADLGPILKELADYTRYHFRSEELWMLQGMYPEMVQHKRQHATFLGKIATLQTAFRTNQAPTMEMLTFLEEWIVNHILQTDARFGRYLLERRSGADGGAEASQLHG